VRCGLPPLRCAQSLWKLRQAIEVQQATKTISILAADAEWQSCDKETKKQILTFYDDKGNPYIYRPLLLVYGLEIQPISSKPIFIALGNVAARELGVLLTIGFNTTIPSTSDYDTLWHLAFSFLKDSPSVIAYSIFNVIMKHHHCCEPLPLVTNVGIGILDEAAQLDLKDEVFEALIIAGANIEQFITK
jgi:hypothetical protein